jgi:hypothetical protein
MQSKGEAMMKRIFTVILALAFLASAAGLSAADLVIDYQMNVAAADDANNYLSFTGKPASVKKDQFDAVTGASKLESTALFNVYRYDVQGGKALPGGMRSLLLYPVAGDPTRLDDALAVTKDSTGVITVRYVHRGVAYELVTDKSGKYALPGSMRTRKIGYIAGAGPQVISADFSSNGKASGVDWKKVWDASIADKVIGATTNKTGPIAPDEANSSWYVWTGTLQLSLEGKIFKIAGELAAAKK